MSKRTPGLQKRGKNGIWYIDKRIKGYGRLYESTGTSELEEAERYLTHRLQELREQIQFGARAQRTFRQAATKYLEENLHKRSIDRDAQSLKIIDKFIGVKPLNLVHQETLKEFISFRQKQGVKSGTVNRDLAVVRRILNLAARLWCDDKGRPWLDTPPLIQFVKWNDARKAYPMGWDEQERLFSELPDHLREMALFKVNTGAREQEVCSLLWEWEFDLPELGKCVFVIPEDLVKNGEDRLIVLNSCARSVIDRQRGKNSEYVFTFNGHPVDRINTKAWRRAREVSDLPLVRVHDLKHTFGRRLRAAGVGLETRKVLLGHKNNQITTHYSAVEISELVDAVEKVSVKNTSTPTLTLLRSQNSRKIHAIGRGTRRKLSTAL